MACSWIRLGLFVGLAVAGAAGDASRALAGKKKVPSRTVECGETLSESVRVANNLRNCPGGGLIVGAPGITIDLGGHRIDGTAGAGSAGIDNAAGHAGVVIRNGIVQQFEYGVLLENASGNTVTQLHVLGAVHGIRLVSSSDNAVSAVVATGNDLGIALFASSDRNTLARNDASGNSTDGFYQEASIENVFLRNRASANGAYGFELFGLEGGILKRNVASGNGIDGIILDGMSSGNLVKGNRASGNDLNGIEVVDGPGNVLVGNTVQENGEHGILSETGTVTLTRNRASGNGFLGGGPGDDVGLGISAPPGATSRGNRASGNDDPNECEAADLDCHVP